ncbi:lipoprotein signal peptidase [Aureimonas sp. Leaf454]|uniref:signal peptidase II n=1 Tax=Aureimonas sp. Leaf454 TaxID=1736381 RepID=UPI0006F9BEEE|nr:signal peptidase II [Aureimonas sp. Leaf454]KQT43219.1 lipoprotein signal peptidase [Aureimonas sp. Leaf454]
MRRPFRTGALIILLSVVADQAIKALVVATMPLGASIPLLPFLALFHARNEGIAFSMFDGFDDLGLALLAGAVLLFVGWLWWKTPPERRWSHLAFAMIVGGAVGNLIDRLRLGYVVDYIFFHTPVWSFAVFNLADALISIGAALVILDEFLLSGRADKTVRD